MNWEKEHKDSKWFHAEFIIPQETYRFSIRTLNGEINKNSRYKSHDLKMIFNNLQSALGFYMLNLNEFNTDYGESWDKYTTLIEI